MDRLKRHPKKIDRIPIPNSKNELRLFVVARNESLRLPYFFKHYTNLGVDRFFLIDNNSTDDTTKVALSNRNVHVFEIDESYKNHWNWIEHFLDNYAFGNWCLVVDVDELFHFPFSEKLTLKQLISFLEQNGYQAMKSILLDMYSNKPLDEVVYNQNENPIDCCNYFDCKFSTCLYTFFDRKRGVYFESEGFCGGVRHRVFGNCFEPSALCLTKISLLKYSRDVYLVQGMHAINGAKLADIQGAVLHMKLFSDFRDRAREESIREEHYMNGAEYKVYNNHFSNNASVTIVDQNSIKFTDTAQLIELGLMKSSEKFESFIKANLGTENGS